MSFGTYGGVAFSSFTPELPAGSSAMVDDEEDGGLPAGIRLIAVTYVMTKLPVCIDSSAVRLTASVGHVVSLMACIMCFHGHSCDLHLPDHDHVYVKVERPIEQQPCSL